jgi:GTP-dependent phosphoenolpyruvate carboxykinase
MYVVKTKKRVNLLSSKIIEGFSVGTVFKNHLHTCKLCPARDWEILIVIYTISGIKAILQDSSVKITDDEGVSPSSSVITRVSCNML